MKNGQAGQSDQINARDKVRISEEDIFVAFFFLIHRFFFTK